jgi:hypothetical protein
MLPEHRAQSQDRIDVHGHLGHESFPAGVSLPSTQTDPMDQREFGATTFVNP